MNKEKISIVIPAYNEEHNLPILYKELRPVLATLDEPEVIFINDGSTDNSLNELRKIASEDARVKVISLSRNFGQTLAMGAGVKKAQGDVVVILDSDLQNDPSDIPMMLDALSEGADVVSGWRKNRWQNQTFSRKLPSVVANWLISKIVGLKLHDAGCQLKAYRREVLENIDFIGETHRIIHVHAYLQGAQIVEVVVNDRPRKHGESKYGMSRVFKLPLDILVAKYTYKYFTKPIYFFGGSGFLSYVLGFLAFLYATYLKLIEGVTYIETPLLLFTVLMLAVGTQLILMGLLADMILRTRTKNNSIHRIKEEIGF